jgi:uncharacterized membrane protein
MLILIKLAAIATVVIFFQTGKHNGENGFKWALIGFIGFALGFAISMTVIGETLISIIVACIVVYFTRLQLLKMLEKTRST